MTKAQMFKLANAIANVLEGDRQARLALAFKIIKENRLNEVDQLIDLNTLTPKMPKKESIKNVSRGTNAKKSTNKKREDVVSAGIVFTGLPANINALFTPAQCDTITYSINQWVSYANRITTAENAERLRLHFNDGMAALAKVQTFQELQATMITYFLSEIVKYMIYRYLEFGLKFKCPENIPAEDLEQIYSYQNAPSNDSRITLLDVEDVFNELVIDAYRLVFNEHMFDDKHNVMHSLFLRVGNILMKDVRRYRKHFQPTFRREMVNMYQPANIETAEEKALRIAEEMGFDGELLQIIKLRLAGYKKKEIDAIFGKRTDRQFQKMEKMFG